jgi:segregation and condensation protein A
MPSIQEDYTIQLDSFEGPLDLLLHLIHRAEVDIQDIPIAQITDQYLLVLRQVDAVDMELAGDFLVMAATLMELKSRTLVPVQTEGSEGEEGVGDNLTDPRQDLVQQLLAYQRIRTATEELEGRRTAQERRARVRIRPSDEAMRVDDTDGLDLEDVHVMDLADSYEDIASAIDFDRLGDHHIAMDEVPIELYQQDLLDRLQRRGGSTLSLQETFAGRSPSQRLGLFLGLLELVRTHRISCQQEEWGEPITLELRSESDWIEREVFADEPAEDDSAGDA